MQVLTDHVVDLLVLQVLRPAAPPSGPDGSIVPWLVTALVLAVVVAGGVYLTSRR